MPPFLFSDPRIKQHTRCSRPPGLPLAAVVMEALFITSNLVGYYRFYLKRL
ncbi:hypothetical protein JWG42_03995 [Desulfoprunum benzoelyticum]|uniref:Uncharacterized protein n=1 Tax=Desulfoprunum benzoelyticum TaxID=1506996 RepID=A0A840V1X4_9BACT|nr:hypothetical protein [Desulfoprunum benzoelyticum]MBB5347719.1 hypothetical protein [Desulfoprunum benzoelyticum]MBM9529312.1 hypothetical protein [Desulfoprunum benzoelyticum]